jgi:hypothetical protein
MSMTQQLDQYGVPLSGCQLYIIQAGTTSTPQNSYKDTALSQTQPNPMICDASGRLPQFFLADGQIKIRLLDRLGNPQVTLDNILVIGPTSGGGSGATIDPTTIAATGDLKHAYGIQAISGWVRFNGRTIGNATSGATERANADTNALFLYLWAADANLAVSGGRTTAAADYAANKTITLPDARERTLAGLGDMGNTDAARLTSANFGCSPIVLGCAGGTETRTLAALNLPPVTSTNPTQPISVTSADGLVKNASLGINPGAASATAVWFGGSTGLEVSSANNSISVTSTGTTSTPLATTPPRILVTIYIKL